MAVRNPQIKAIIASLEHERDTLTRNLTNELARTALPFAPLVKAEILNIPVKGLVPYKQPPGLRIRIARCVRTFADDRGSYATVGLYMDVRRMPSGQYSLPLGMQGTKRWRHPLFGDRERWFNQGGAPHPYFYDPLVPLGPASRRAVERSLDRMTAALERAAG